MDDSTPTVPINQDNTSPISMFHKTLARQIKKYMGENPEFSPDLQKLLEAISATYNHADEDRHLIERSLDISSRELTANYHQVRQQVEAQTNELRQRIREAEDTQLTMKAILDNLPVGVFVVSAPDGAPFMMNRMGLKIAGRSSEEVSGVDTYNTGFNILQLNGDIYPNDQLPLTKTLRTGQTYTGDDMILQRPDGSQVAVRAFTAPILRPDGTFNTAVAVYEDISEARKLEHTRDEFFAIASHELRTPLTSIRGNSSMILDYYGDALKAPELAEMVNDIHESSVRLINIVNDFLDMSRLEQQRMKFDFRNFDIIKLIDDVTKEYEVTGRMQGVEVITNYPEQPLSPVYADTNRLRQVLINLIGNALKFTKQGRITIGFNNEGDRLRVYVSDTGSGISETAKKMLFHKFEQSGADPLTRDSVHGTGLGLYISRLLIEHMNGDIRLDSSELGQGSTFSFSIPFKHQGTSDTTSQ